MTPKPPDWSTNASKKKESTSELLKERKIALPSSRSWKRPTETMKKCHKRRRTKSSKRRSKSGTLNNNKPMKRLMRTQMLIQIDQILKI